MSLSPYMQEKVRKLNRYARRREAQNWMLDACRSYNYFMHTGSSWNIRPRNIGLMERFTLRLINAITDAISPNAPEPERFRLFDALRNAIDRYHHYKHKNM